MLNEKPQMTVWYLLAMIVLAGMIGWWAMLELSTFLWLVLIQLGQVFAPAFTFHIEDAMVYLVVVPVGETEADRERRHAALCNLVPLDQIHNVVTIPADEYEEVLAFETGIHQEEVLIVSHETLPRLRVVAEALGLRLVARLQGRAASQQWETQDAGEG
jgi:hypothetical protein